jgi:hypothetical protein
VISSTQELLPTGHLKIARSLPHAALLARELVKFRFKVGHERSEDALDWREGPDDDLVLALTIATWQAERNPGLGFSCSYFIGRGESERPACFADLRKAYRSVRSRAGKNCRRTRPFWPGNPSASAPKWVKNGRKTPSNGAKGPTTTSFWRSQSRRGRRNAGRVRAWKLAHGV